MKQKLFFSLLLLLGGYTATKAQTQFWSDDFEDSGSPSAGSRVGSISDFTCLSNTHYFLRATPTTFSLQNTVAGYTNYSGSKMYGFEDIDYWNGCANSIVSGWAQTITWSGINITGKTNLSFKGLFGADNVAFQNAAAFPTNYDYMEIEYRINAGAWTKIIGIYANSSAAGGGPMALDNNNDLVGDGTPLTYALSEISANITGTGTTLDLRFNVSTNATVQELGIDNFRLIENTGLPITLSSFEARKENGTSGLYWTTAKEVDNAAFDIQRSSDGKIYQTIGTVATKARNGNSIETLSYSYYDKTPFSGMNFYRLAEKDKKDNIVYSDVRTLNLDNKSDFNCYPNPVKTKFTVEYNSAKEEVMNVRVTDVMGKVVLTQAMNIQKGFNKTVIDMSGLGQGIYNMTIIGASGMVHNSKVIRN